jgi:hypothetical protein
MGVLTTFRSSSKSSIQEYCTDLAGVLADASWRSRCKAAIGIIR